VHFKSIETYMWKLPLVCANLIANSIDEMFGVFDMTGDAGVQCWYDMEAERLEVADMCRGIAKSRFFLLYLTQGYFTRWFCRLEAAMARRLGAPARPRIRTLSIRFKFRVKSPA
jgi:hypothetical protein